MPRIRLCLLLLVGLLAAPLTLAGTAGAEIGPPWCGTPIPDGTAALPDGSSPSHPIGSFPHIPWYAIGCTLDSIAAQSNGRMTVAVTGKSALGYELYAVTINALDTEARQRDYDHWKVMRRWALTDPARAQSLLEQHGANFKLPILIQAGIHGNESEGIDADMRLIERLATTPYGADPFVDNVLDHAVVIFNVIHNPDGHILNQRANGNNFDLNRDWLTQSQPETKATVPLIQEWLAPELLDQHGYVTPTLIEATTKPHNPGIEYDFWLKWNQARIDANEAAMNAIGLAVTRPVNDWCENANPPPASGICPGGTPPGPAVAEGWDDWGPFYTPMYSQLVGLNGSTVEMCNQTDNRCGVPGSTTHPKGRVGSREAQYSVATSTLTFDIANRKELWHDQLEIYRRGVTGASRPPCCPPPFDVANNWMHEYPEAYVIPVGRGQRSDAEANRLVEWLFFNGIRVWELTADASYGDQMFDEGSYVVSMNQALRGLADTALGIGVDISGSIGRLYAPPGAWSHGYLWGADIAVIPNGATFAPAVKEIRSANKVHGGLDQRGRVQPTDRYVLELDSPTAVRTLNAVLKTGLTAQLAAAAFGCPSRRDGGVRGRRSDPRHARASGEGQRGHVLQGVNHGAARPRGDRPRSQRRCFDRELEPDDEPGHLVAAEPRVRGRRPVDADTEHGGERPAPELRPRFQHRQLPVGRERDSPCPPDRLLRPRRGLHRRRNRRRGFPDGSFAGDRPDGGEPERIRQERHRLLEQHRRRR